MIFLLMVKRTKKKKKRSLITKIVTHVMWIKGFILQLGDCDRQAKTKMIIKQNVQTHIV